MFRLFILILTLMVLVACSRDGVRPMPDWVENPGDGVASSAGTHVKGRHFQEELAIARARERLASRLGVEVSSVHTVKENVINDRAYINSAKETQLVVQKQEVKAHVRAIWYDRRNDQIWVWLYPIND